MLSVKNLAIHSINFYCTFLEFRNFSAHWAKCFPVLFRHDKKIQKPTACKPGMSFTESYTLCLIPPKPDCFLGEGKVTSSCLNSHHFIPVPQTFSLKLIKCAGSLFCWIWTSSHICCAALMWTEQLMITSGRAVRVLEPASARAPMGKLLAYREAEEIPPCLYAGWKGTVMLVMVEEHFGKLKGCST